MILLSKTLAQQNHLAARVQYQGKLCGNLELVTSSYWFTQSGVRKVYAIATVILFEWLLIGKLKSVLARFGLVSKEAFVSLFLGFRQL